MNGAAIPDIPGAIRAKARTLGFDRVGFCDVPPPVESSHFERWLSSGMHATMSWLEQGRHKRLDPALVLEGARSIIVTALSYAAPGSAPARTPPGTMEPRGVVSRYALGDDYHRILGDRLALLEAFILSVAPGERALA